MKFFPAVVFGMASLAAAPAWAATAEETYKAKCSTCHDAGLAGAPARAKGVRHVDNKLIPKDLFAWD